MNPSQWMKIPHSVKLPDPVLKSNVNHFFPAEYCWILEYISHLLNTNLAQSQLSATTIPLQPGENHLPFSEAFSTITTPPISKQQLATMQLNIFFHLATILLLVSPTIALGNFRGKCTHPSNPLPLSRVFRLITFKPPVTTSQSQRNQDASS